jgi:hypothetical protein
MMNLSKGGINFLDLIATYWHTLKGYKQGFTNKKGSLQLLATASGFTNSSTPYILLLCAYMYYLENLLRSPLGTIDEGSIPSIVKTLSNLVVK